MLLPFLSFCIKILRLDKCYETLLCSFMLRSILMHNFTSNCIYFFYFFFISWPVLLRCSENNSHSILCGKKKFTCITSLSPQYVTISEIESMPMSTGLQFDFSLFQTTCVSFFNFCCFYLFMYLFTCKKKRKKKWQQHKQ